jgi:hypothetical protein
MKNIIPIIALSMTAFAFFCSLKIQLDKEELKNSVEEILNTPDLSIYLGAK